MWDGSLVEAERGGGQKEGAHRLVPFLSGGAHPKTDG